MNVKEKTVCVVGLGYVGMPLAEAFSQQIRVIGFDIDTKKLKGSAAITFTDDEEKIKKADFVIIAVPTPVTKAKDPDLAPVISAAHTVGRNVKKGAIVVLESTVYPGVTEDIMVPILEKASGMRCGTDFFVGYSPERINPGDDAHDLARITKIVAGMDTATTDALVALYGLVTTPYRAPTIMTAEAAKVIENVQRDLNIALMNELSLIFSRMDIDTRAVIDAAATKWNFHPYTPGLVGGHCIPVDPYYLVYKARELGYHAKVILAGRDINDAMPRHVAQQTIHALNDRGTAIKGSDVLIMGLTYKENVADTRESPVETLIEALKDFGIIVYGHDPLLSDSAIEAFGAVPTTIDDTRRFDAIIITVAHDAFVSLRLDELAQKATEQAVLFDVRQLFDRDAAEQAGFRYLRL